MKVRILSVDTDAGGNFVVFECSCGFGRALWHGDPPEVGADRWVELEAGTRMSLGVNASIAGRPVASLASVDGTIRLTAQLLRIVPENGIVELELDDARLTLDYDPHSELNLLDWYDVVLDSLELYDMRT